MGWAVTQIYLQAQHFFLSNYLLLGGFFMQLSQGIVLFGYRLLKLDDTFTMFLCGFSGIHTLHLSVTMAIFVFHFLMQTDLFSRLTGLFSVIVGNRLMIFWLVSHAVQQFHDRFFGRLSLRLSLSLERNYQSCCHNQIEKQFRKFHMFISVLMKNYAG